MTSQLPYHFSYAISKQLPTACSLNSSYGELELDEEMRSAIEKALVPILEKRLNAPPELEKNTTELSTEPGSDYLFDAHNIVVLCKSCGKQLSLFQVETDRLIPVDHPDRGLCNDCCCPYVSEKSEPESTVEPDVKPSPVDKLLAFYGSPVIEKKD